MHKSNLNKKLTKFIDSISKKNWNTSGTNNACTTPLIEITVASKYLRKDWHLASKYEVNGLNARVQVRDRRGELKVEEAMVAMSSWESHAVIRQHQHQKRSTDRLHYTQHAQHTCHAVHYNSPTSLLHCRSVRVVYHKQACCSCSSWNQITVIENIACIINIVSTPYD